MIRRFVIAASMAAAAAALTIAGLGASGYATAAILDNGTCESLSALTLPDTTITSAAATPAGPFTAPGATATTAAPTLPAFCRVAATIKPTADSHIRIEIWLPPVDAWNGEFLGTGNGGAAGIISYPALVAGIQKGFTVVNTDMGTTTRGLDFSFGIGHPELQRDWAYRATHLMTVIGKAIAKAYYDRDPRRAYFTGCSTGGHQAITEAHRYPDDYDGIVAGDPANNRIRLHTVGTWNWLATHEDPESYFPASKLPMIHKAVVAACDKLDGLEDGLIDDPRRCHFDPMSIVCGEQDGADCLTKKQAIALAKIYQGPRNPRTGEQVFPGMYPGSEGNPLGIDRALSTPPGSKMPPPGGGLVAWAASWKGPGFDFDHDLDAVLKELDFIDDADPNLSAFRDRGGKLVLYSGWADPLIPSADTVSYYEHLQKQMGGAAKTENFARLFMIPGMGHCAGGDGPNRFDALAALQPWVEKGTAPEQFIATHATGGKPDRTRPICAYPKHAKYMGSGSIDDAANFACVVP
jgi:feruloyl esterase